MKINESYFLGIDTSNYTTSVALIDSHGRAVLNNRKILEVKNGERGLRQSDALFQHLKNLPGMLEEVFGTVKPAHICAVSVSDKPRPIEDSYMPVFLAGVNFGRTVAAALNIPLYRFSHQEGHVEAVIHGSCLEGSTRFLSFHLSGGTSELLLARSEQLEIIGGTKDIAFGQVIDRIGVAMDMKFPAGPDMDNLAASFDRQVSNRLKKISMDGLYFNLSGIETQCQRLISDGYRHDEIAYELFIKISDCIIDTAINGIQKYSADGIVFAGGVSSSKVFRIKASSEFEKAGLRFVFGDSVLSTDNAVGTALLGMKKYANNGHFADSTGSD